MNEALLQIPRRRNELTPALPRTAFNTFLDEMAAMKGKQRTVYFPRDDILADCSTRMFSHPQAGRHAGYYHMAI